MLIIKIIAVVLGLAFLLFGYFIYFRKKYNLINGFEADRKAGRKTEAYTGFAKAYHSLKDYDNEIVILEEGAITLADLDEFSDELKERMEFIMKARER